MNWAHIHLLINHFPIVLVLAGTFAALYGLPRPRRSIWMYASVSLALAGLTVIPTYFTGEPAADWLHRPWYIARGSIHAHESSALLSAILTGLAGLAGLAGWRRLVRYPRETVLPGLMRGAMLLLGLAASSAIFYTSWLGGKIVHDSPVLLGPPPAGVAVPEAGRPPERGPTPP